MLRGNGGPVYSVPISSAALSTAGGWELQVTADSSARCEIIGFSIQVASTLFAGTHLSLQLLRGSTTPSTGASISPRNLVGWSGATTAAFAVAGLSSNLGSTTSAILLWTGAFSFDGLLTYRSAARDERFALALSQRLNFRFSVPPTPITLTGHLLVAEVGKNPS